MRTTYQQILRTANAFVGGRSSAGRFSVPSRTWSDCRPVETFRWTFCSKCSGPHCCPIRLSIAALSPCCRLLGRSESRLSWRTRTWLICRNGRFANGGLAFCGYSGHYECSGTSKTDGWLVGAVLEKDGIAANEIVSFGRCEPARKDGMMAARNDGQQENSA